MISDYFTEDSATYAAQGIVLFVFDDSKTTSFLKDCLLPFRRAYIEDSKLDKIVANNSNGKDPVLYRKDAINRRIPDPGDVMSGDFGEILTYYMAIEIWSKHSNVRPKKWQLKDDKKKASPKTDVVLFHLVKDIDHPDENDMMITYEAKAHADPISGKYEVHKQKPRITYKDGKDKCSFVDAVFDADKDRASRAAESIIYLKTRAEDLEMNELCAILQRFEKDYSVAYQTEHNAVAIVESTDLANQIARMPADLMTVFSDISLFCLPIKNLKSVYTQLYKQLQNT